MSKIRFFNHSILWLTTVGLLAVAVFFVAARFVIAKAPSYTTDVEQFVSQQLGEEVTIGSFSASLDGFKPQLKLIDVSITDSNKVLAPLKVGEIRVSFDFLNMLRGRLTPQKIILSGTSLSVTRYKDGRISLDGLPAKETKNDSTAQENFAWILDDGTFEIINSNLVWNDEFRGLPALEFNEASLILHSDGDVHTVSLGVTLPELSTNPMVFIVSVTGDILSSNDWDATGYLKIEDANLTRIKERLNIDYLKLKNGMVDLEIWNTWENAAISDIKGRVLINDTELLYKKSSFDIKRASSRFSWQKIVDGWSLNLADLAFQIGDLEQSKVKAKVEYLKGSDDGFSLAIKSSDVDVHVFSTLLKQSSVLDAPNQKLLKQLNLKGSAEYVDVRLEHFDEQSHWAFCGKVDNFSNNAVNSIPETKNITTAVCSTDQRGWASLDTANASVYLKKQFNNPFQVDVLRGVVSWNQSDLGLKIQSEYLQANSPHVKTETRFKLNFLKGDASPLADIQMNIGAGQVRYAPLYIPLGVIPDTVDNWLNAAFKNGMLEHGGVLVRGDLGDYPFRDEEGVFEFFGEVENVNLHYADEWPDVEKADAEVEIKNEGLAIRVDKGSIAGNDISFANIEIKDLGDAKNLSIGGRVEDQIKGLYNFFWQSPLKDTMRGLMKHSRVLGEAKVDLNLQIPLQAGLQPKINVKAQLNKNTFVLPDIDLAIRNIKGTLSYSDKGLTAKRINATVFDKPASISIKSAKESTVISLNGELDTSILAKKYPSDLWGKVSGKTKGQVNVSVPLTALNDKSVTTVELKTNLAGITVDLPQPMGKAANGRSALTAQVSLASGHLPISFRYAEKAQGAFVFKNSKNGSVLFERGNIHIGGSKAILPQQPGLKISGSIDKLNVEQWLKALSTGSKSTSANVPVNNVDLKVGELAWDNATVKALHVTGKHSKNSWVGKINSSIATGAFVVPDVIDGGDVIQLDLTRLEVPKFDTVVESKKKAAISPTDIPDMDLKTQQLFVDGIDLGSLELELRKKNQGLVIDKLLLKSGTDELNAQGAWEQQGDAMRTGFDGNLTSESLGSLFGKLGIYSKLEGAQGSVTFDINWPGRLVEYSNAQLNGFVKVEAGGGTLLDIEPGIGRLFGVFNLSTLQRRMKLDFSDVVMEGFAFDEVKGGFVIVDGNAEMNGFYLRSPSSRLGFEGQVSLKNEEINQLITVVPTATESLPVAGAILGGPLVGAAVFIVQKIAGKTVNEFAGYQYQATGPWADIKIKQISQPGGKIFSWTDDKLKPVFNATDEVSP